MDKPTIIFSPEILENGFLKACFKLGLRNRMSRQRKVQDEELEGEFQSSIFGERRKKNPNYIVSYEEVKE